MTHPVSRLKMAVDDVPEFTLVVCVREPAVLLAETLRTLAEMRVPSVRSWEVLVVGYSAVNDSEPLRSLSEPVVPIPACHIVDRFADQLPVRWVEGSDVGIHSARRRAVDASRGDWIIFTEGDVHIQPDFFRQYLAGMERYPEAALFGGTVVPRFFRFAPPDWLQQCAKQVSAAWGCLEHWKTPFELGPNLLPTGTNFAVRRDCYRNYTNRIDSGVASQPAAYGEVDDIAGRMLADGFSGFWLPDATIYRLIQREQATLEYLRDFYFRLGIARAGSSDAELSRSRPWLKALRSECLFQVTRAIGRANWWVKPMREASCRWGFLRGMTRATPQPLAPNSSPPSVRRAA
jgi:hypothetical protein